MSVEKLRIALSLLWQIANWLMGRLDDEGIELPAIISDVPDNCCEAEDADEPWETDLRV